QGASGGRDGAVNTVRIVHRDGVYVPPHLSKDQDIPIVAGDVIEVSTPGGGGFGDPLERDPALVSRDLTRGYYSPGQAREWFAVVVHDDGRVNLEATSALRAGIAAAADSGADTGR